MPTNNRYSIERKTYHGASVKAPIGFDMGLQIVPRFPSMGYAALTHGGAGQGLGYYDIKGAYPEYNGSCTRYGTRACGGLVKDSTFNVGKPPKLPSALIKDSGHQYQTGRSADANRMAIEPITHGHSTDKDSNGHNPAEGFASTVPYNADGTL